MGNPCALTSSPGHHFFGYYEKSPWNGDESMMLGHRTTFQDRRPTVTDAADICLVSTGGGVTRIASTRAWDFQQGAMLQWIGPRFDRFIYNDRAAGRFVSRIHDQTGEKRRTIREPVYAVSPVGETAFTLDFGRLDITRPGYGYASEHTSDDIQACPVDDGVFRLDLETGSRTLLVSLAELSEIEPTGTMDCGLHWVNHIQCSPTGERIAFIHRSETPDDRRWLDRLYVTTERGTDLQLLHSGLVSHYDWRTDDSLLVWTDHEKTGFHDYSLEGEVRSVGHDILPPDGHCSFSPNGEWLLLDSSPDDNDQRGLFLYEWERDRLHELTHVYSPPVTDASLRCDLHPRWDRSGRVICFDSTHEGTRQMYTLDVSAYTA